MSQPQQAMGNSMLLDLPSEILTSIFTYLDPADFLSFCKVSKNAYGRMLDPYYWRTTASRTFRLPISPLLHADGARWFYLFRKLKTQTRLYTWGQGVKGNLGPARTLLPAGPPHQILRPPHHMIRGRVPTITRRPPVPPLTHQRTNSQWPTETHVPDEVGVIVDLQCGGWSTTVLSSDGKLFTVGILDAGNGINVGKATNEFERLEYLTQSTSTIRQFSSGRRHVLALDDNGEIITWDRINAKGYKVFSRTGRDFGGKARRVVAGWGDSSAYVPEAGIVYWQPIKNDQQDEMLDGLHVKERIVPGTARRIEASLEKEIVVEVISHVVLEGYIVYITSHSRVYACTIDTSNEERAEPETSPFEVPGYSREGRQLRDVQGSFRSFAIFTASGDVLAGDVDYLRRCSAVILASSESVDSSSYESLVASRPADVPALQNAGVIEVAVGDHHYHALHTNGTITSYGTESQCCGSLGLGDINAGSRFRGVTVTPQNWRPDAKLLPIANLRGRQVWFEPEKKDWLKHLQDSNRDTQPGNIASANYSSWAIYSEWIEQEGRHWAAGPNSGSSIPNWSSHAEGFRSGGSSVAQTTLVPTQYDFNDLGAYFAISVAAAGWHSGALVLVDEAKAEEVKNKWTISTPAPSVPGEFEPSSEIHREYVWNSRRHIPRIPLPDLAEMPGNADLELWRDGMPTMEELGLVHGDS